LALAVLVVVAAQELMEATLYLARSPLLVADTVVLVVESMRQVLVVQAVAVSVMEVLILNQVLLVQQIKATQAVLVYQVQVAVEAVQAQ
jgi:hypothetical protein